VIDWLTQNKYGAVNHTTILLLSASMPFLYFNNFLWTVSFAKGQLKMIFYIFLISFICNLVGDIILIPFYHAEGAAVAYLAAIIIQSILYFGKTDLAGLTKNTYSLLISPLAAISAYLFATALFSTLWVQLLIAPGFYILLLYLCMQIRFADWLAFKRVTGI
jgi:O-antigen/teichoic acid export membrane protein